MEIIFIEHLKKIYERGRAEVSALHDVTLTINEGEYISIVGKSGSGKSTLLNIIGGLDRPSAGSLIIKGKDLNKISRRELSDHRKFTVGMIFQSFNLIYSRTLSENITLALAFGGIKHKDRKIKANELLDMVGLAERTDHKPSEISGGEAQRVAIARALANNPEIILADEPTGNLDSATSEEIISILKNLNEDQGKTIIMVTHDIEIANSVSDRIITLKDGMIINN